MNAPDTLDHAAIWTSLRDAFRHWTGMRLSLADRSAAMAALEQRAQAGELSLAEYLRQAHGDAREHRALVMAMGLRASWFMRDEAGLRTLAQVLKRGAMRDKTLWLWSAGCSTGEEAYSLVMALADDGIRVRVLGTDINDAALEHAREGRYDARRLRHVPKSWLWRYFDEEGGGYRVKSEIKRAVTFEHHDLTCDAFPPEGWFRFDALICRNVVWHFERDRQLVTIRALASACRPKGYLLLGAIERSAFWVNNLTERDQATELAQVFAHAQSDDESPTLQPMMELRRHMPRVHATHWTIAIPNDLADADAETLLSCADEERQAGQLDRAMAFIDAAIERSPRFAPAYLARGLALKQATHTHEAIEALRTALFLDNDTWLAPYQLALCLESLGKVEGAREAYRHALGVLEHKGATGLHRPDGDVEMLARTTADVCRERVGDER